MCPAPPEDDPRWRAVVDRDASADGAFVYAVETTGIYCRPSCTSRQPNPKNVTFHDTPQAARRAGYRACKRCHPDEASALTPEARRIADACRTIEQAETPPKLEELAAASGLSEAHFHRKFKEITGLTPKAYGEACRAEKMREALDRPEQRITDAIYAAGFNAPSRFYERAAQELGMSPTTYKKGGAGMTIRFALGECALGSILVAQSEVGICAISLGETPEALLEAFQARFGEAELVGGDESFEALVAQVVGHVEAPGGAAPELPLDIRGTAFQRRVWQALRQIPAGETRSYAEVAEAIGAPTSSRAVAQACGANTLAVLIPCHRVVRQDGSLSGYRWGVARKKALLAKEREEAAKP